MPQCYRYVAIVDDDVSTREALARLLRKHGISSRSYPSASAFLKALPSDKPDCLIVDVNIPEMTGLELQRELLNLGVCIPIIVITASDDESIASAVSVPAGAYLVKPVTQAALMVAINSAVKTRN